MSQPTARHRLDYAPSDFSIDTLNLIVRLDDHHTRIVATSRVRRQNDAATTLVLTGEAMSLLSVSIDGQPLPQSRYQVQDDQLMIKADLAEFELVIETEIDPANNTALEGLYKSQGVFCTQCEAEGFRRITYFLDRPDVLARYTTRIEAPKADYPFLLGNGNKVDSGELEDGWHFATWEDPFPKPSYLFALVAGDFDRLVDDFVTRSGRKVELQLFVDKGQEHRGHHAIASLKAAMKWDEDRFGLEYDLDIYMVVAVDFFNMGAMENKGLNVFNSKCVLADGDSATDAEFDRIESIIGHEYFHNWTGNRITCRDWFQLSLKEGLTVFRDQEFSSDLGSRAVNRIAAVKTIRGVQFAEDAGPMAHPIRPEKVIEMNNFYTVTVYDKGAEIIRMMHTLLGEAGFQKGMQCYVERHDGQAVTCDDFVQAMEDASGVDLTLFRRWYSQSGTPHLNVTDHYDPIKAQYTLTFRQHTPATADQADKQPLHIPVKLELLDSQGNAIAAQVDGQPFDGLYSLMTEQGTLVLEGVNETPVVSLLQEFSAPVKLEFAQDEPALCLLMAHANNAVARWDAAQSLLTGAIYSSFDNADAAVSQLLLTAFESVLAHDHKVDAALVAELLNLPSVATLLDGRPGSDVVKLYQARVRVQRQLATALKPVITSRYDRCQQLQQQGRADAAIRSLKNTLLELLALDGDDERVSRQFAEADNMTDSLGALTAANRALLPGREDLMSRFEARWHDDVLVMDKWFSQTAMAPQSVDKALAAIEAAMSHPRFDMANPNRVRALIGAFAEANPVAFHDASGKGYAFLVSQLKTLNGINPQCAARIITPLIGFKRHDDVRQQAMKAGLTELMAMSDLSKDLYEKVSKSLS